MTTILCKEFHDDNMNSTASACRFFFANQGNLVYNPLSMEVYAQEIIAGLVLVVVILAALIVRLEVRLRKILRGNRARTIEESIGLIENDVKALKRFRTEVTAYLEGVEKRLGKCVQGISTVRFNPFRGEGIGGNQSFATSFISEKGDGVVLSSLYSRDRVSVFAKPLKNGRSEYELTGEEREAVEKAKERIKS